MLLNTMENLIPPRFNRTKRGELKKKAERQLKGLILFFAFRLFNTIMLHLPPSTHSTLFFSISRDKHFLQNFIAFKNICSFFGKKKICSLLNLWGELNTIFVTPLNKQLAGGKFLFFLYLKNSALKKVLFFCEGREENTQKKI
jgi:hypothetical protein